MILTNLYTKLGACEEASGWAEGKTLKQAWNECHNGSWMLWSLSRIDLERKQLVLICCDVADLVKEYQRPEIQKSLRITRAWCVGKAEIVDVKASINATAGSINNVYMAAYAAVITSYVVNTIDSACLTATYVACVAYNTSSEAHIAHRQTLAKTAEIVRNTIPYRVVANLYSNTSEGKI